MTTRYLTGAYPAGYALKSKYSELIIEAGARVGGTGVSATSYATILNHGVVNASGSGVFLHGGGSVINGSAVDTGALIETTAGKTVSAYGHANKVINYGTVQGGGFSGDAVRIYDGSSNVVTNFGTLAGGGALANGLTVGHCSDVTVTNTGLISGPLGSGIWFSYDDADNNTVGNSGTIEGGGYGILFQSGGGMVTNGSDSDTSALIGANNAGNQGQWALASAEEATVFNFGTIVNWSPTSGNGVALRDGGTLANGSAIDRAALIEAYDGTGIMTYGASAVTVTNFGTIAGAGTAVSFSSSADVLQVEAGCAFEGAVFGAGGALDLASGQGRISGLHGGNVTVSGSMAKTAFSHFGTLDIADGARFKLKGTGTVGPGGIADLVDDGTLVVAGALTGTGTLAIDAGTLTLRAGASVGVSTATFGAGATINGAGVLTLTDATVAGMSVGKAASVIDSGTVDQTGGILLHREGQSPRLIVTSRATWKLDGDVGIARRMSENPVVTVDGLLVKSAGSGVSAIGVSVKVGGVAETATGTLDFLAKVTGSGTLKIDAAATLECRAANRALTASFAGARATLALNRPPDFAATIDGFASGDTVDLLGVAATSAVLGPGDTLVIADGSTPVASLQLSGDYAGDTFATASDGKGGTNITLSTSRGTAPPASLHPFIAAAARLGGEGGEALAATHLQAEGMHGALGAPSVQAA